MKQDLMYVPVLKAKEGEFKGLGSISESTKDKMVPLFEIINVPWNYTEDCESKTIDNHLDGVGKRIQEAIGDRPFFVDSRYINEDATMNNGDHHLKFLFDNFREMELNGIPVTSFDKIHQYKNTVKEINDIDGSGICLRIESNDLASKDFSDRINDF